jgi:RNA polymerase I-specific transcription initiation factor RRN7
MAEADDYEYSRTGERCAIDGCRSRRYRTNEQGFEECSNGHQHGLARGNINDDEDAFFGTLRGKRSRKGREKKEKVYKRRLTSWWGVSGFEYVSNCFVDLKGKEAFELYLLSYQLVLRKQVWWLVHEKKLPNELEVR